MNYQNSGTSPYRYPNSSNASGGINPRNSLKKAISEIEEKKNRFSLDTNSFTANKNSTSASSSQKTGSQIKTELLPYLADAVGESEARRILGRAPDKQLENYYSLSLESENIYGSGNRYMPINSSNTPLFHESNSLFYAMHDLNDKQGEKAAKLLSSRNRSTPNRPSYSSRNNSSPSSSQLVSGGEKVLSSDISSLLATTSATTSEKNKGEYKEPTNQTARNYIPSKNTTSNKETGNATEKAKPKVEYIDSIKDEKTRHGIYVDEIAFLLLEYAAYRTAVLDGKADKNWTSIDLGTYAINDDDSEEVKKHKTERLKRWKKLEDGYKYDGLDMATYYTEIDGKMHIVVVNIGSDVTHTKETLDDWADNFTQVIGFSDEMRKSIKKADELKKKYPNAIITFAGYSKGGAEAAANAVATNMDAVLFNPSSASFGLYGLKLKNYTGEMVSYIMDGEILSETIANLFKLKGSNKKIIGNDYLWDDIRDIGYSYFANFDIGKLKENTDKAITDILHEFDTSIKLHSMNNFFEY